jgi:hypothetical protein
MLSPTSCSCRNRHGAGSLHVLVLVHCLTVTLRSGMALDRCTCLYLCIALLRHCVLANLSCSLMLTTPADGLSIINGHFCCRYYGIYSTCISHTLTPFCQVSSSSHGSTKQAMKRTYIPEAPSSFLCRPFGEPDFLLAFLSPSRNCFQWAARTALLQRI